MPENETPEVFIEENSPRDGLQNERELLTVKQRVELIDTLSRCGFRRIQIGSFVNPRRVPQMAELEEVWSRVQRRPGVVYSALVLNGKGLDRAVAAGLDHVSVFVSASEEHSRRNAGCSVQDALADARKLIRRAKDHGLGVQAGVMNAFGCRYEGPVEFERVLQLLRTYVQEGADEINLADTVGTAHPKQVETMVAKVREIWDIPLALHLHDTFGFGMANLYAAWRAGVNRFDTCCGGLGGCPFIPGAPGNLATEDVVHLFEAMGVRTGIALDRLAAVVKTLQTWLGRPLPGRYAGTFCRETPPAG